jgi:uncharacterized membrane protein
MEDVSRPGLEARNVEAGQGVAWWSEAWALFMKNPGLWLLFGLVVVLGAIVLHLVPLLGGIAVSLVSPVIAGGWMLSARKVEQGGTLQFDDLFSGFREHLSPLLMIGVVVVVCDIVFGLISLVLGLGALAGVVGGATYGSTAGVLTGLGFGLLGLLVALVFAFAIALLLWFAPSLVVFDGVPPIEAMKLSVSTSLRNVPALIVFGLISILLFIPASLTVIGLFVLIPLEMLAMYTSYKGIFGRSAAPVA